MVEAMNALRNEIIETNENGGNGFHFQLVRSLETGNSLVFRSTIYGLL